MLPSVSHAVLLSMGTLLVAVGFGSSEQLFSRDLLSRHASGDGRLLDAREGPKRSERGREATRARLEAERQVVDSILWAWRRGSGALQVHVSRIHRDETKQLRR